MTQPTIDHCIAVWNSPANAETRRAAAPPTGPIGSFFAADGGKTTLHGGRPYEIRVAVGIRRGGPLRQMRPPGCVMYFRYAGDETTPPSMLTVPTSHDLSAYDLSRAVLYHGRDNTNLLGLPALVQAADGSLSLAP